jgi:Bacterial Ig-like domain
VSDPAENSSIRTFVLDVAAQPVPPAPTFTTPNEITDTATPTIIGRAAPSSQISVFDGATLVGTATAGGSGNFAATLSDGLALGSNDLTATATNAAGGVGGLGRRGDLRCGGVGANGGVVTEFGSVQFATPLGQGYQLAFIGGTEAVTLVDGTLSVGPDTGEALFYTSSIRAPPTTRRSQCHRPIVQIAQINQLVADRAVIGPGVRVGEGRSTAGTSSREAGIAPWNRIMDAIKAARHTMSNDGEAIH